MPRRLQGKNRKNGKSSKFLHTFLFFHSLTEKKRCAMWKHRTKPLAAATARGFLFIYLKLSFAAALHGAVFFLLSTSVQEIVSCLCVFGISHFSLYYLYSSTKLCQLASALSVAARHLSQRERQVWIARKGKNSLRLLGSPLGRAGICKAND